MSWAMAVGTGISVVGGMFAGKKADKAADAQMAQQQAQFERQMQMDENNLNFSKEQYADHKAKFDPLFDDIRGMMDDVEPDYGAIAGDINSSFDSARGMEERNMRRYGIKPTDGASRSAQREYGIKRGAAHVGARSQAREGAKDKRYGRYSDLYNSGQGIGTQNASMVSNAMANSSRTMGYQAQQSGQNANYYNGQANQAAQGWGNMVGGLDWGGMWNSAKGWYNGQNSSGGGGGNPRGGI